MSAPVSLEFYRHRRLRSNSPRRTVPLSVVPADVLPWRAAPGHQPVETAGVHTLAPISEQPAPTLTPPIPAWRENAYLMLIGIAAIAVFAARIGGLLS